jgi:tetratricopeptide (TPR) repeat protein
MLSLAWLKLALGELAAYRSHPREMVEAATKLRTVAEDFGAMTDIVGANRALGEAQIRCGAMGDAQNALERALELSERIGERSDRTEIYAGLAAGALSTRDLKAADRWAAQAMASSRQSDVYAMSYAHRIVGQVHAAMGRDVEGEESLRLAIAVTPTDYRTLWAEDTIALAAFCVERGRRDEALAYADDVETWTRVSGYTWLDGAIDAIRTSA